MVSAIIPSRKAISSLVVSSSTPPPPAMTIWCLLTGTVVVEGKKSTRLGHMTKPFFWQQHGQSKVNDRPLCRKGECVKCWKSRATASVHIDCLYGFIQSET